MTADPIERVIRRAFETGGPTARVHGVPLLTLAIRSGRLALFLALARTGADAADRRGRTALFFAGTAQAARRLLDQGAWATFGDCVGRQPLHAAARAGRVEVVQALLASGAQVNDPDRRGWTALHHAAAAGQLHCVAHLLSQRANPGLGERYGRTALDLALVSGHVQVMTLLAAAGARRDAWVPQAPALACPRPLPGRARAWRPAGLSCG